MTAVIKFPAVRPLIIGLMGLMLSFTFFFAMAPKAEAASLTSEQVSAIINLLRAFNADSAVISQVQITLGVGTVHSAVEEISTPTVVSATTTTTTAVDTIAPTLTAPGSVVVGGDRVSISRITATTSNVTLGTYTFAAGANEDVMVTAMSFTIRSVGGDGDRERPATEIKNLKAIVGDTTYPVITASTGLYSRYYINFGAGVRINKMTKTKLAIVGDIGSSRGGTVDLWSDKGDFKFFGAATGTYITPTSSSNATNDSNYYWSGWLFITNSTVSEPTPPRPVLCVTGSHSEGTQCVKDPTTVSSTATATIDSRSLTVTTPVRTFSGTATNTKKVILIVSSSRVSLTPTLQVSNAGRWEWILLYTLPVDTYTLTVKSPEGRVLATGQFNVTPQAPTGEPPSASTSTSSGTTTGTAFLFDTYSNLAAATLAVAAAPFSMVTDALSNIFLAAGIY